MNRALMITAAGLCMTLGACNSKEAPSDAATLTPAPIAANPSSPQPEQTTSSDPDTDPFGGRVDPFEPKPTPSNPDAEPASSGPPVEGPGNASEGSGSSRETIESISRVIRGTIGADDDEGESKGSIFRSIGRALTKGAQEAASSREEAEPSDE